MAGEAEPLDYCLSQGTAKRWDQVAAYVRTRTVDEVIDMAKHGLAAGKGAPRQDTFTVLKKHAANVTIKSDATARDEVFTDVQVKRSSTHYFAQCCYSRACVNPRT